jgi:prolipoprotein diacylglyceryltransferase
VRVLLLSTDSFLVLSYPAMMFFAVLAGGGTLAWRARHRVDQFRLGLAVLMSLGVGWVGSRLVTVLLKHDGSGVSIQLFVPSEPMGMSFTAFIAFALPVFLFCVYRGRRPLLAYFDVVAPSVLIALAVAKIGCLLAGCCAGSVCPVAWGLRYPYGSKPYVAQVADGRLAAPELLVPRDENGIPHVFAHVDLLRTTRDAPPREVVSHANRFGLSYAEFLEAAGSARSLSVWPVPLWYSLAGGLLWLLSEAVFLHSSRAGWTTAIVLVGYSGMRLGFDSFLAIPSHTLAGWTLPHVTAGISLCLGIIVAILASLKITPSN